MRAGVLLLVVVGCLALAAAAVVEKVEPSRLIEFGPGQRKWMTQSQLDGLVQGGKVNNFMDVTDTPVLAQSVRANTPPIPSGPTHQAQVDGKYIERQNPVSNFVLPAASSVAQAQVSRN